MTHKIIQTEKYLLIVDNSQITEGDYCLANAKTYNNEIVTYRKSPCPPPFVSNLNILKKMIAHLPLNGASTLNNVDLLPQIEDDVERLAEEYSKNHSIYETAQDDVFHGFFQGYKKAKEKYKYTEKDMKKAFEAGQLDKGNNWYGGDFNQFIQSHQTKMPIGFEFETKDTYIKNGVLVKTQWVGKYIFE
jgi:hypothetical protein